MEFVFDSAVIKITEDIFTDAIADLVISEKDEPDRNSFIEVIESDSVFVISLHWSHFTNTQKPTIYWNDKDKILFLGAGYVSAVINIKTKKILDINYPDLFWAWELIEGNILELGELDCRLYSLTGQLIGHTQVDPPYDYHASENAIHFSSIVIGKTSIEYM